MVNDDNIYDDDDDDNDDDDDGKLDGTTEIARARERESGNRDTYGTLLRNIIGNPDFHSFFR